MPVNDSFQLAEDRYFVLRGQLETGKLTRDQFEVELKKLMLQDTQGRYWVIGPDTGKWYVHDGTNWIESSPPQGLQTPSTPPQPRFSPPPPSYRPVPTPAPYAPAPFVPAPPARSSSRMPLLLAVGGIVILCLVGALVVFFTASQGIIKVGQAATGTPSPSILPTSVVPTPIVLIATNPAPTLAPFPTTAPTVPLTPTSTSTPTIQPSPTITPTLTTDQLLQQADALTFKSQYADANALYDKILAANPNNALALTRWSRMLLFQQSAEGRSDLFDLGVNKALTASQLTTTNAEVVMRMARAYDWKGDYAKALSFAQNATSLAPDSAEAYAILAEAFLDNDKLADAETAARKALQLGPNNAEAHRSMGFVFLQKKDTNNLVNEFEKAVQAEPNLDYRLVDLAFTYRAANDCTRAIATAQQTLKLNPRNNPSFNVIGRCQVAKGDLAGASDTLKQLIAINANSTYIKTLNDAITAAKATPTPPRPTAVPTAVPPTAVPTAALPPNVYVKDVRMDPSPVRTNQLPTFQVTFINSNPIPIDSTWYVKIFEPGKTQSFGETTKAKVLIPVGESTFASVNNWKAAGNAQCRQFVARIWYQLPDNSLHEFPKPGGDTYQLYFSVCD